MYNNTYGKKLYLTIEITQLLNKHNCTYNEADAILTLVADEFKQQREDYEYNTVDDFLSQNKSRCADNELIKSLNHVDGYC